MVTVGSASYVGLYLFQGLITYSNEIDTRLDREASRQRSAQALLLT